MNRYLFEKKVEDLVLVIFHYNVFVKKQDCTSTVKYIITRSISVSHISLTENLSQG